MNEGLEASNLHFFFKLSFFFVISVGAEEVGGDGQGGGARETWL